MDLRFVQAVRIVVDLGRKPNERVDVSSVRQVFFGGPGKLHARKSINDSLECTWHIPYERDQDLSEITYAELCPDNRKQTVYYLLYKDPWAAYNTTSCSRTDTIINFISRSASDFARSIEAPRDIEFVPGYKKNSDPRQKKDIVSGGSVETYFRDQFMLFFIPGYLLMLSSGREGFDQDGMKADGSGGEDVRMLPVRQQHNKDPNSAEVFVSYATLEKIEYA